MSDEIPPPEAYGRVTDPQRYEVVVEASRTLVSQLVEDFDAVAIHEAGSQGDPVIVEAVRVVPRAGVPLVFSITDFPGVAVQVGDADPAWLPICGCDACDESPAGTVARMRELVAQVTTGGRAWPRREVSSGDESPR